MYALFALAATFLTSLLPMVMKVLLRETRPAVVAWAINAVSLPLLAGGTLLLTQCQVAGGHAAFGLSCCATLPQVDGIFFAALLGSAALNWGATLLSTRALAAADASLVSPLLAFNPAFTLLVAWLTLGEMPGGGGLSAAKALHEQLPSCRIVILTTFGRSGYLRRAMESGAVGFLLKEAPASELAVAIRRVMDGDRVVDPELALAALAEGNNPLTSREREVLAVALSGASLDDIAARLSLSEGTVRNHLSVAIQKLGARNRMEAARLAEQKGWL